MATGQELITAERLRQQTDENFDAAHDDKEHWDGALARAAESYRVIGMGSLGAVTRNADQSGAMIPSEWPWEEIWWKPKTRLSNLVRAGALFQAEIDRLTRQRDDCASYIDALPEE
jgi:hypothetical protein